MPATLPIALARTPARIERLARWVRSADELVFSLASGPRTVIVDADHPEASLALARLAALDGDRFVIVVIGDKVKDGLPGADLLVTWDALSVALAGPLQRQRATIDVQRLFGVSVLAGQIDQALEHAADEVAACFEADGCVISIRGDSSGGAASGAHTWDSLTWNRTAERCRAAASARATLVAPVEEGTSACESYVAVPLEGPGASFGFVGLVAQSPVMFRDDQRSALAAIAGRLSRELAWRAIHQRTTDELDRLGNAPGYDLLLAMWNRMAMTELANMQVSAARRSVLPLSAAVVDVVDLQSINMRYGLETGDRLLRRIADAIRATIRVEDIVGRWAGDKIAVLLHGTGIDGAQRVAERLRAALDARPLEVANGHVLPLPATVGFAAIAANEDAQGMVERALQAAKAARESGLAISRALTAPEPRMSGPIDAADELRTTVGGAYRLQHEISRGGMGVVYRAEDLALERPVALKMLRPDLAEDRALVEQLRVEAAMLARLHHPNLVQIYSFGQSAGESYIVMELVEGEALQQAIERHLLEGTQVPIADVVAVIEEIGSALDALHERGIVHRDVKPSNVIRDPFRERAVLVDVGIARKFGQFVEAAGTPGYVAPEVIGGQESTPRSDVYGLAATAYALLTLVPPWGDDAEALARQTSGTQLTPPSEHRAELAPADDLIAAALAHDPRSRPASAGELARSLRAALALEASAPRAEPAPAPHVIMPRRTKARTRGVVFRSVARAVGVRDMQRLRDAIGGSHPEVAAALTDSAPLAWIPTELFSKLLSIAPLHLDRDGARLARDIARATVRASFRRFFPASAATLVPERTLSAMRSVWGQYQSWGKVSSMPVNASEMVVRIADGVRDPELCVWTEGLVEQLVVLSGGRGPIVDHEACVTRGDPACLYRVTWDRRV